jgi:hypothetical protein
MEQNVGVNSCLISIKKGLIIERNISYCFEFTITEKGCINFKIFLVIANQMDEVYILY